MRKLVLIAVLALLVPAAASARPPAPTPGPAATPLPPDQAAALVAAPAAATDALSVQAVSPQEALAAASAPGAAVYVAPGLSLQQAVGARLGAAGPATTASAAGMAAPLSGEAVGCSAVADGGTWGTWPYEQRITFTVYWCAVYGNHITYYSATTNGGGTLCGVSWTSNQPISGGIPYSWVVQRGSAGFSCPTVIPWVNLHPSHYLDVSVNAWGSAAEVGRG